MNLESLGSNICLSGGADGADLQFGMCAGMAGYDVIHWSFAGHRSRAPDPEVIELTNDQLLAADEFCMTAAKLLKKYYPPKSLFVRNLLRRNYYQVAWSEAVYAVATIKDGQVQGGTGWAVQMFRDRFDQQPCACYVFCQDADHWFKWEGYWLAVPVPPIPTGTFAGIGTRPQGLKPNGILAIRFLLNYQGMRDTI